MTTPSPAALARDLMLRQTRAALATLMDGAPYVSLVLTAFDEEGRPLLLLSDLAQHTRNLRADPRISLLLDDTTGLDEPLTGARLTVLGRAEPCDDPQLLARYVAAQPSAERYAGFSDFHLFRVTVERGHLVAGFGRIEWIEGEGLAAGV